MADAAIQRLALARTRTAFTAALLTEAAQIVGADRVTLRDEGPGFSVLLHGEPHGVLAIDEPFTPEEAAALQMLADQAGVASELARVREDQAAFVQRVGDQIAQLTGADQVVQVARLADGLAEALDLSTQARHRLWQAAFFALLPAAGEFLRSGRVLAELAPLLEPPSLTSPLECWVMHLARARVFGPQVDLSGHHPAVVEALEQFIKV